MNTRALLELESLHEHLVRVAVMPGLEPYEVDRLAAMVGEVQLIIWDCSHRDQLSKPIGPALETQVTANDRLDQEELPCSAYQHSREFACVVPQELSFSS